MSLLLLFNDQPDVGGSVSGSVTKALESVTTTRKYGTLRPYSLPHISWLRRAIDNITILYQSDSVFVSTSEDLWTQVILISDFTTTNSSNTNVTDFKFTPDIDSLYFIEMFFLIQTTNTSCGPRPGISWPSNLITNGATLFSPISSTGLTYINWNGSSTANTGSTALNTANIDYLSKGYALLKSGPITSGDFQITLASEDGTNVVQMTEGSFFKYRKISN